MGFFNKKQKAGAVSEKKGVKLNELKECDLLNVAGGREYSNQELELANRKMVEELVNG